MTQLHPIRFGPSHRLTCPILNSLLRCAAGFDAHGQIPLPYSPPATLEQALLSARSMEAQKNAAFLGKKNQPIYLMTTNLLLLQITRLLTLVYLFYFIPNR